MATTSVPTLSPDGWLHTTPARCDALFADFLSAANSQYPLDKIEASLPWLLVRHQDDIRALEDAIVRVLTTYYERYFRKCSVICRSMENPSDATRTDLFINLTVIDEVGENFTLGKIATVGEQRVLAIAKENNGSLPTTA